MRDVLRRLGRGMPSHVGLAYDVWAPVERHDGKLATAHGEQRAWLEGVRGIAIDPDYAAAYARWSESFAHDGRCAVVQTTSRLLVGHGNASATDVGLTVHHAWGVPMIPGSALAGVTARYVDAELGGPGPERERWRGPEYDDAGVVERLPGDRYGCLFGVPELGGDPGARGLVTFCDALYVPGSAGGDRPFREDVLTVHHKAYYDGRGSVPPTDYEDPNPVSLLTVGRGVRFLLAVTGPAEWTAVAMTLLCEALARRGVGGKTSSGYGRLGVVRSERGEEGGARRGATATARAEPGPELSGFLAWIERRRGEIKQRELLEELEAQWRERLLGLGEEERRRAAAWIRKWIGSKRLRDRVAALEQALERSEDGG